MENNQMTLEKKKLDSFLAIIQENLAGLREQKTAVDEEAKMLFDAYTKGDTELYSSLMVALNLQEQVNGALAANEAAEQKPYFGRVDYLDRKEQKAYSLYIGKHGISHGPTEIVIVDWRAAAASIYYECGGGEGAYQAPTGEQIPIRLDLKRTFDIEAGKLLGFYDSDTAANDELLIKYLAKNKDVVLGEIIATIQQEQNRIIRERHNRSMIVQGVAGSGKTTVAVHRISYLLYNYSDKYAPEEFCVIGSNQMLLNYITSALPSLDVKNTKQYRMDQIFLYFLQDWLPENKYHPFESGICTAWKASYQMAEQIETWTREREREIIPREEVTERGEIIFPKESICQYLELFASQSLTRKMDSLNARMAAKIKLAFDAEEPEEKKEILKKYRKYFSRNYKKKNLPALYADFLSWLGEQAQKTQTETGQAGKGQKESREPENRKAVKMPDAGELSAWIANVKRGKLDVYDLAAMNLIAYGWLRTEDEKRIRQVFIDEAQDFGVLPYYVLRRLLPEAVFMVMGDVSQNIHFDSGMNDWKELREHVFCDAQDRFYTLCKSYRNTIEISACASRILDRTSFETYPIEPIVRRGEPVGVWPCETENELVRQAKERIRQIEEKGYDTIAVICRDEKEAKEVRAKLGCEAEETASAPEEFKKGVLVLPIALTKGLEFDAVLLWNPSQERYSEEDRDAKLLYVAVTRALHELHLLYCGELCGLLRE